jgi:23S rRNA-/tRNA-specific pseudouridylate synthase
MIRINISPEESGQKILKFLLRRTDGTKVFLFKLFRKGLVLVNRKRAQASLVLDAGDQVQSDSLNEKIYFNKLARPLEDLVILYEDEAMIAVDKDEKTLVHTANRKDYSSALVERVKNYLSLTHQPSGFLAPVHRIDRNTKGIVLFAKTYIAAKDLSDFFHSGKVKKTYTAVLKGILKDPVFVEADIQRLPEENRVKVTNFSILDKAPLKAEWMSRRYVSSKTVSATLIRPLFHLENSTKAEIEIWTGRHHQIRAVCEALGHPVEGDRKYNKENNGLKGQSLICKKIILEPLGVVIESKYND